MEWLPVAIVLGVLLVVALIIIIAILVWGSGSGGENNSGSGGNTNTETSPRREDVSLISPPASAPPLDIVSPLSRPPSPIVPEVPSSHPSGPQCDEQQREPPHDESIEDKPLNLPFALPLREDEIDVLSQSSASDLLSSATGCSQPVDLRSASSSSGSIPSTKEGSVLASLCREEQRGTVCRSALDRIVTDICSFSSAVVIVMSNGHILKEENGQTQRVNSNLTPQRMEVYNGYLHCLHRGAVYRLDNSHFRTLKWVWKRVRELSEGVTHISATLDGRNLWLQYGRQGRLYNESGNVIHEEKLVEGGRRIYGMNRSLYVNLQNGTATTSNGNIHHGVFDALLTYHNELIVIKSEDAEAYRGLRLVNWRHYVLGA